LPRVIEVVMGVSFCEGSHGASGASASILRLRARAGDQCVPAFGGAGTLRSGYAPP
jgi:hypothetical protein